jgi:copper chaperone CopZ
MIGGLKMKKLIILLFVPFALFADQNSKTLYVKGMSCTMCVKTVTDSLVKANISATLVEVGSVTVKDQKELNCKVAKAIEGATEYKVYLDKDYTKPACPKS